jgi:hypothetical protein
MNMQQFACPQMPGNEQITASIAAAHGAGAVEMLLERSRDAHGRRSHGLAEFLQAWLATAMDFETVWDLGFGRALRALETDEVDAVDVLAEVACGAGPAGTLAGAAARAAAAVLG